MKKTLRAAFAAAATATAALAASMAAPAIAQPYGHPASWDIAARIHWIEAEIIHGRDDGSLDRREFERVEHELNGIRKEGDDFRRYHGGMLDDRVRLDLEARLDVVNDQIHWLRAHNEHRPW